MMEWMGAWMILWALLGLALLTLAVLGIAWLVRSLSESGHGDVADSAEQELRRRYAAGELTRDEYQRRLTELRHH